MTAAISTHASVIGLEADRYIVAVDQHAVADLWKRLAVKARPAGLPAWRWLDVQAGFPLVTAATKEEFVPQMADFEKLGGISFHKGCYPGQEIVARTQYCGKVVSGAPSPAGGYEALAVVQANFAGNLHLGSRDGPKIEAVAVNP
jgi:hypothetical protein